MNKAKIFILVHGAWQGSFSWMEIVQGLIDSGQQVSAPDLPGHGKKFDPELTITFDNYTAFLVELISQCNDQVVLVGHSMGGMVISAVAELIPEKIERLIYITAHIPENGQSLFDISSQDVASLIPQYLEFSQDQRLAIIRKDNIAELFSQDASDEQKVKVIENYHPELTAPLTTPVSITADRFGRVSKHYIFAENDNAISFIFQKSMADAAGITSMRYLKSGHMRCGVKTGQCKCLN